MAMKHPHLKGVGFSCFNVSSSFSFSPFSALVFLLPHLLLDIFKPKNGPPNEVLGYIYIYFFLPRPTFQAIFCLELGKESACFDQKKHDQFWSCSFSLAFFPQRFLKKVLFCNGKHQKIGRKQGLCHFFWTFSVCHNCSSEGTMVHEIIT